MIYQNLFLVLSGAVSIHDQRNHFQAKKKNKQIQHSAS